MTALDPEKSFKKRGRDEKESEDEKKRTEQCAIAREHYGFNIVLLEDNLVRVRDSHGREADFQYPMEHVTFDQYDRFISQMQDPERPLPPIDNLVLAICKPVVGGNAAGQIGTSNSATIPSSWERHAHDNGMDVDEMKWMYFFAREELYKRFKSRIRK